MTTAADYNDVHIQGGWKCVENVILTALPPVVTRHVQLYSDHSIWFRINQSRSKGVLQFDKLFNSTCKLLLQKTQNAFQTED